MPKHWSLLILFACQSIHAQGLEASIVDGGSVVTTLGYNIKVNDGSSLHRSWVVLNDSAGPVQLTGAGIATAYAEREYRYQPKGTAKTRSGIAALEVRFLLFDTFGNHMKTLSATEVRDVPANGELPLTGIGTWRAWENEVSELLTVVAFVAQARTADGKVWRYNEKAISNELFRIQLQAKSGILEPTKQQ